MNKLIKKNKKALFNYTIYDKIEAGISLTGSEVKALADCKIEFNDAYITFKNNNAILKNLHITIFKGNDSLENTRDRQLLLHKNEINKLQKKCNEKGFTIIPLQFYFVKNKIKVEIALAKGKNIVNKKNTIKERDIKRSTDREMKRI